MAVNLETLEAGGPAAPARPLVVSAARTGRRIRLDRWASRLVVVGGIVIIAAILAILFVIVAEVYPLFKAPTATLVRSYRARIRQRRGGRPAPGALGVDEYREIAYAIDRRGAAFSSCARRAVALCRRSPIAGLDGARVTAVAGIGKAPRYASAPRMGASIPLDDEVRGRRSRTASAP